ncbi:MAG: gliding motility-associated C-terminal domain-containing protein [Chitinophagales bacterium]|nr:gliding motility-associated C-terminal domain-containing protein [Chitinophagales bacterium]
MNRYSNFNKSRHIICALIYFLFFVNVSYSQIVYSIKGSGWGDRTEIKEINIANCTQKIIYNEFVSDGYNDIAFCPDGNFYLLGLNEILYKINIRTKEVSEIPIPRELGSFQGLVSDAEGKLYLTNEKVVIYDVKSNTFTDIGILPEGYRSADLTVYKGDFYLSGRRNTPDNSSAILRLNTTDASKSEILFTSIGRKYSFVSMATTYNDCDDVRIFGFGSGADVLVEINLQNGSLDTLCTGRIAGDSFGGTSPTEFLSSDTECDLLFDLDRDNSSGEYPYDFRVSGIQCTQQKIARIVDGDVYLNTSAELDSIVLTLSGALNGMDESIWIGNAVDADFTEEVIDGSTKRYVLKMNSDRSDESWKTALRSLDYFNLSFTPVPGERQIRFEAFNSIKSKVATTYILIDHTIQVGRDTTIAVCGHVVIPNLSTYIGGEPGAFWNPPLSRYDVYDSALDTSSVYRYLSMNQYCPNDTSIVTIIRGADIKLDIPSEVSICGSETYTVVVPVQAGDVVTWSDGSTESIRVLSTSGRYSVTITKPDGCSATATIDVKHRDDTIEQNVEVEICPGTTYKYKDGEANIGDTIVDRIPSNMGCDTLLIIRILAAEEIRISRDTMTCDNGAITIDGQTYQPGMTIEQRLASQVGCDTILTLHYQYRPSSFTGVILSDTVVCEGDEVSVSISGSGTNIQWSNGKTGDSTHLGIGRHSVTGIDDTGCLQTYEVEIGSAENFDYEIALEDAHCGMTDGIISVINHQSDTLTEVYINGEETARLVDVPPGQYEVIVVNEKGCFRKDTVYIIGLSGVEVEIDTEISGKQGSTRELPYRVKGGTITDIGFDPVEDIHHDKDKIVVNIISDRVYEIRFIDENGCEVISTLQVKVDEESISTSNAMANIISMQPNNAENGRLFLKRQGVRYDLRVYDRWGNRLYEGLNLAGGDAESGWIPGSSKVQSGVYVYRITVYDAGGKEEVVGSVTVVF